MTSPRPSWLFTTNRQAIQLPSPCAIRFAGMPGFVELNTMLQGNGTFRACCGWEFSSR